MPSTAPTRVVVVGAGFAGFEAVKELTKGLKGAAEVVLLNPTDYFLYLPLLPEIAAGIVDPRRLTVSLTDRLKGARLALGEATGLDLAAKTVTYTTPEDEVRELTYDHLVLTVGSVNKLLPIPGVAEHAHGFRGIPEAVYVRDHVIRQLELADATDDQAERDQRCTFVVVGAGYTGTELAAQGALFTRSIAKRHPRLEDQELRWMLLDVADTVLPGLDPRLGRTADKVLKARGVEVAMGTSVAEARKNEVELSDGRVVPTRSLLWCVGVQPDPLVSDIGLETQKGRLVVDEYFAVPGHPEVLACGDAAAVPDLTRPGETTAMTAQHAVRQGRLLGTNLVGQIRGELGLDGAASPRPYRHHDLGFIVDLGGFSGAANPLGIPLGGLPARVVARAYHLTSMPGNRIRTAVDWLLAATLKRENVQLGLVAAGSVPLDTTAPESVRRPS